MVANQRDLPERRGIDEPNMTPDNLSESVLGTVPSVAFKQLVVGVAHGHKVIAAG